MRHRAALVRQRRFGHLGCQLVLLLVGPGRWERTYSGVSFLTDDEGAFNEGGAGVVDAVEHGLHWLGGV